MDPKILTQSLRNPVMTLITKDQMIKLVENGKKRSMTPVIKLFGGSVTWLVCGIDGDGILEGYADLSQGYVEFGTLCHVEELPTFKTGIAYIERDRWFKHVEGTKYFNLPTLIGI